MLYTKLSLFYLFYFSLLGVMAPYMGLYLEEKGFGLLEIAELTSLLMFTKIVAPNIWGFFADKYHRRLVLVRLGTLLTLICFVFFFYAEQFWQFALIIVCFSFFWNAVLPQFEVITLHNLADQRSRYSRIRLWGSIGFILTVVLCGWLFEEVGIGLFPVTLLVIILLIWLSSLSYFAEPSDPAVESGQKETFLSQLTKPVVIFFLVCFLLQLSHGTYYTYFSIYLDELGYDKLSIGGFWSLGVIAEVLLFLVMHRWFAIHSLKIIILIALCLTALRWLLIAHFAEVLSVLLFAQVLHAMSFGAMHAASIHFVHRSFSPSNQGRAQALYSSAGFGAGGAAGAYASGLVVDASGVTMAFLLSAVVAFIAVVLIATQDLEKNSPEIG